MTKFLKLFSIIALFVLVSGCGFYSFTGASICPENKTFQVNYFQNNALLIEPGLDRDFTNALTDLLLNQTNLELVKSGGDMIYEGEITEYRISPTTATANNTAAQNRLTMSVNVRYYDKCEPDETFEQRFTFFYDYAGNQQLIGSDKDTAHEELFERLTQDIFNATLAKW
ncbi:LPS assembly lipoprotein LptE [Mangrovimonas sp. AS39]|uniref:LptE family protein n=1 Tax=Mangrovimonas TaxID=1211036 RepID=UPI00141E22D1|nr:MULTISPECIES: LptE family protein [Mangrovimonas]MCF1192472.1 LPS assembly lipoprotein LptE [Mangrovimonas futianensis]MCF1196198.1 LPS assembly lipoprotein LptE [Mangrovimonas futianensis]MCF1422561.1 LPS assembly lipoprotein LptE [Mangrovimonas futianensis]NIK93061.1 LptE family protein [Mangrovimonas sp. CR14]